MLGKSAVPDPWSAIVALPPKVSNSATPPLERFVFASWLAITSTAVVESPTIVHGTRAVVVDSGLSPRYPIIPGTPDQSSLAVIIPVFDQSCAKGRAW